eukprot:scaffold681_cov153-Isochrysis_galbana.AAC.5
MATPSLQGAGWRQQDASAAARPFAAPRPLCHPGQTEACAHLRSATSPALPPPDRHRADALCSTGCEKVIGGNLPRGGSLQWE